MPLTVITPPEGLPVDLTELKDHLRLGEATAYDTVLNLLITAIVSPAQQASGRQLITATLQWTMSRFQRQIELPRPPLKSVEKLEYRGADGQWRTLDAGTYEVNIEAEPGYILFPEAYGFPATFRDELYPVRITYTAGYGNTYEQVPATLRLWMKNIIGTYWLQRSSQLINRSSGSVNVVELEKSMGRLLAPHNMRRRFG